MNVSPEIKALYDEATKPQHASRQDVHDQLRPIAKAGSALRKQVALFHEQLLDAKLAPHDPALDSKLDRLTNILKPIDGLVPQFISICEQIGEAMKQWDRVIAEDTEMLQRLVASAQSPGVTTAEAIG